MSTEQNGKQADNQQPAGPVPLLQYPVAWTGTGHTNDVRGACEPSDRLLLSLSYYHALVAKSVIAGCSV